MKHTIQDASRLDDGIVVTFKDGTIAYFDSQFLYAQLEKRVPESGLKLPR
jgi:hypothetical protein